MRTDSGSLGDVLFGQTRGGILALLYSRTDESFYVRQIARSLGISVGSVQRELENLSKVGLINRSQIGNQVFYRANQNSPVFGEIRALVAKTVGTFHVLRSALEPLAKRITVAFVYGSLAHQQEKADSDVDVMIIGKVTLDEVLAQLDSTEASLGRTVNPTVYSIAEYKSKFAGGNHFLNAVIRGKKVFLFGDEDELREMGGIRLVKKRSHKPR
ncbi:MAG: nucleotidyltransferase [Candidatus Korobacteraceae bacterium]